MFKGKTLVQLLVGLLAVIILPLALAVSYATGTAGLKMGIFYGIVAYTWLMLTLYVGTKPTWLKSLLDLNVTASLTKILSLVALLFTGFHKELSPNFGLVGQTGQLAFMVILSFGFYGLVFGTGFFAKFFSGLSGMTRGLNKRLANWLQALLALANGLVFVHTLAIDGVRGNLLFMGVFLTFSLPIFAVYLKSRKTIAKDEVAEATILSDQV